MKSPVDRLPYVSSAGRRARFGSGSVRVPFVVAQGLLAELRIGVSTHRHGSVLQATILFLSGCVSERGNLILIQRMKYLPPRDRRVTIGLINGLLSLSSSLSRRSCSAETVRNGYPTTRPSSRSFGYVNHSV